MSKSLVLRLAAPLQSWGVASTKERFTETVPTRSGLVGMLAASLGLARGWQVNPENSWLGELTILARVERAGRVEQDFHTINSPTVPVAEARKHEKLRSATEGGTISLADEMGWVIPTGDGKRWATGTTMLSTRHYLADAEFLVALTHPDDARVDALSAAAWAPHFMNYLGRKAFTPTFPYHLGVYPGEPAAVLSTLATTAEDHTTERTLRVHHILGDHNRSTGTVTVPVAANILSSWKAAQL